ncbi:CHRD domain-containing protein [Actinotalea sp. Marseille-Q4924]|uniref:CHRD domain-containing protein n=1 Tax=Actinotalea sp. Marseille-Q4924 TaxID=2866571 RepID=UPI001CE418FF|nr:CHRD domain-containing protein [Actinotalea sp. Marseille-Q4924]
MRIRHKIVTVAFGAAVVLPLGAGSAFAADADTNAQLAPVALNGVEGSGTAMVKVEGTMLTVTMAASGLLADSPHAAHIHFGADARNECPTAADDASADGTLNTTEGGPAYGGIVVSLTKTGDTSPDSGLAVDRFDTAPGGELTYERGSIEVAPEVADAISSGKAAVVIHGVDHNDSGAYDGDVMSDLDPSLPTEATDPALCGVLMAAPAGGVATGAGGAASAGTDQGLLMAGGALLLAAAGTGAFAARRATAKV